ncbi:MAG: hypothetical protein J7527_01600, partial [Chitinophagaceae bacterium]|nr:hypothetical protein [Chitinophagaceae bacterium]
NEPFPISKQTPALQAVLRAHSGRPIILDIFGSTCVVCFTQMPKLQELQNIIGDSLQIILVGHEDARIRKIYDRVAGNYSIKLPVVYDSLLHPQTGPGGYPRCIWIDAQGITRLISPGIDITRETLQSFAKGHAAPKGQIDREDLDIDNLPRPGTKPLFSVRRSLTRWQPGEEVKRLPFPPFDDTIILSATTLATLFRFAVTGEFSLPLDSNNYKVFYTLPLIDSMGSLIDVSSTDRYTYTLAVDGKSVNDSIKLAYIREDLEHVFGYELRLEKREVPYWRFTATPADAKKLLSKGARKADFITPAGYTGHNILLKDFIESLKYYHSSGHIFLDETNIKERIDLTLEAPMIDLNTVRAALAKKGLIMSKGTRTMTVMVLYPKK